MKVPPLFAVFLTILFDTISFGLVIPDLQTRLDKLVPHGVPPWAAGAIIGITLSIFSLAQFIVAPMFGALSDRKGRKIVLIYTSALSAVSSFLYTFAYSLPVIAISRIFGGLAAANLGVAQAYITDVSTGEDRAKSMGVLGMGFGLGFMIGPPLGALLLHLGHGAPTYIGLVSTAFALINLGFVSFVLQNHAPVADASAPRTKRWSLLRKAFASGSLAVLLVAYFCSNFAFAHLESTYYLVGSMVYHVDQGKVTYVLIAVGVAAFLTQGTLIRWLMPILGERSLLRIGYALVCPAMLSIPLIPFGVWAFVGGLAIGVGNGIANPSINSLISRQAPAEIVGEIFGVTASLSALARIIGPTFANVLFKADPRYTYESATLFLCCALIAAFLVKMSKTTNAEPMPAEAI